MISNLLKKARDYEKKQRAKVSREDQPLFHLTAGAGWLNDPNGFSFYQDRYHLFFQYNPYSTQWDTMHWGHAVSDDLLKWELLPCALAPDQYYDSAGCYSGSAVVLPDGRHLLMYTGVRKKEDGTEVQTQNLAFGNGLDYEKYEGNPVIPSKLLPPGAGTEHFRDPKLWKEADHYEAVMANLDTVHSGTVLLYESEDAIRWKFVSKVLSSDNRCGRMWECPDLFGLDGYDVLIVSPMEMEGKGPEFIEGNTSMCLIGKRTGEGRFLPEKEQAVDYGLDFYATHTILSPDGRRILIAWMQYWGGITDHPRKDLPFFGQMTLPRELRIRDGRLVQNPVTELENWRTEKVIHKDIPLNGEMEFPDTHGRTIDLTVKVRPQGKECYRRFAVTLAADKDHGTTVSYDRAANTITADRSRSGWSSKVLNRRTFAVRDCEGEITLRFILDRFSIELFVNGGEQAASFVIFSPQQADGILFAAEGNAVVTVERYLLKVPKQS